jgi:NitT/TauT family transport system permease protein
MLYKVFYTQPGVKLLPNKWDVLAILFVSCMLVAMAWAGSRMALPFQLGEPIVISLDPRYLPLYALETTIRMFVALFFSFIFSFIVATIAAKSQRAGRLLIPLIDILQSVPILGYLSVTVAGFIALFPGSLLGPEFAVIFVVFTSQVWNMTLSFYQSLRTIPSELNEATRLYHLSGWQRFWRLEVPFGMPGLLWNAMMSMSGGWFFIVAAESISIANQNITIPGIGSYIALAITSKNLHAIAYAIIAMLIVILLYDQLFFRPLIKWSEKFRLTDMPDENSNSWVLTLLQRTRWVQRFGQWFGSICNNLVNARWLSKITPTRRVTEQSATSSLVSSVIWYSSITLLLVCAVFVIWRFIYAHIPFSETWHVLLLGAFTAIRVLVLIILCSVIWVPVGIWIGMRPRVAQMIQPIAQFLAAFPANLFFPIFVVAIVRFNLNVEIWTAPLMVLGTQWYILFNVIAGASTIPKELKLAAQNMQLSGWLKWKRFLLPAVFPFYITGAITAAGGSWNASIVAEVVQWGHTTLVANGLGAYITENTIAGNFPQITLGVVVMCFWVTLVNLLFWRKLYKYAETRYALN